MKILTKEEEQAHYNATLRGGITGGVAGLAVGGAAVFLGQKRSPGFRSLTLPLKAFFITSAGTFAAIVSADRGSRNFEKERHPEEQLHQDETSKQLAEARSKLTTTQRATKWAKENRYSIVSASWVASMGTAFAIVSRDKYLTGAQKLVQARVYAQGLTLAVLMLTAAFEIGDAKKGEGKYESIMVHDPNDPEHKKMIEKHIHQEEYAGQDMWKDMIETEDRRLKQREKDIHELEEKDRKEHPIKHKKKAGADPHDGKKDKDKKDGGKEEKSDEEKEKEEEAAKKHKLHAP